MAIPGFFTRPVAIYSPHRGNSSNDWSDPDDFKGADTVRYYVDASAADDNGNGLSDSTPKKTIAAGMALLRAGQISVPGRPDQLLLKRGETWTDESFGHLTADGLLGGNPFFGRSATQRIVIGTYGTGARPHVKTSTGNVLDSASLTVGNMAILGIDFDLYLYPGGTSDKCINWRGPGQYVLIEDCLFRQCQFGILFSGTNGLTVQKNFVIRRNVFQTIYGQQGCWIRLDHAEDMLIEENHFDGRTALTWNDVFVGAGIQGDINARSTGVVVTNNTFSNFGTHAVYLNGGGVVQDNVIFSGAKGIQVGNRYEGVNPGFNARAGGVQCSVVGNYISDMKNVFPVAGAAFVGGGGIHVENCLPGSEIRDNILTRNTGTQPYPIRLVGTGTTAAGVPCPIRGLQVVGNQIYKWWIANNPFHYQGFQVSGANAAGQPQQISDLIFQENDFQEPLGTTSLLVNINSFNALPEFDSEGNRFWRAGATNDRYDLGFFGTMDLAEYLVWASDSSSVEAQVTYPDPAKTIGDYHGTLGGTATQAAYVTAIRAQSRFDAAGANGWSDSLMASAALAYFRANFDA